MGGVITELVLYEQGQYVVRCCLEVEGRAIATGLSAAPTVETAEDQARDRAVALWLNIPSPALAAAPPAAPPPPVAPKPAPPVVQPTPPATPKAAEAPAPAPTPEPDPDPLPPIAAPEPTPIPDPEPEPALSLNGSVAADAAPEPEAIAPPPEPSVPTPAPAATGEPIDFSDVIAKTNLEMKRLGWTKEQGRQYIMETYGKRSRQILADHELVEFLRYLESLPS
jgi:outer membrane biosynthesis protein TonB